MKQPPKICPDCKWHIPNEIALDFSDCGYPSSVDVVTGFSPHCSTERTFLFGSCGRRGKNWEPKENMKPIHDPMKCEADQEDPYASPVSFR